MIRKFQLSIILFLSVVLSSCSKDKLQYDDEYDELENVGLIQPLDTTYLSELKEICKLSPNYGKTVGVFGGSLSSNPESVVAKAYWHKYLGMEIKTYGMQGHGFSSLQGSIQDQIKYARKHDIYILWCSTNDYTTNREIGSTDDYTSKDKFNKRKLTTQCGGMNYCISKLRQLNPNCTIYIFGSLKFFSSPEGNDIDSDITNKIGLSFHQYIEAQKKISESRGVKFFNQWDIPVLTKENSESFYKDDKVHMTYEGYANIAPYQLFFLATESSSIYSH